MVSQHFVCFCVYFVLVVYVKVDLSLSTLRYVSQDHLITLKTCLQEQIRANLNQKSVTFKINLSFFFNSKPFLFVTFRVIM